MNRILIGIVLVFLFGNVSAAVAVKDCKVGASPWKAGRQVDPATEKEYRLNKPLEIESLNKAGKTTRRCRLTAEISTIVIPNGFDPSIDHPGLPVDQLAWIKGCGNPIVSKFNLVVKPPVLEGSVVTAPVVPVVAAQVSSIKEGTGCSDGERKGTHRVIDGQMSCLLDETVRVVESYHRPEPEVVYRDMVFYEEPQQEQVVESSDSSWLPWVIVAGALAWFVSNNRNNNGSLPSVITRPAGPGVITGPAGPGVITRPVGPGVITRPAW